ncbi:hypothetical protein [Streptomyces sp. NPDC050121]|uniref:hypothetical protein n=1 Tax=Streptomyces sp. NPDC050121 TaxID=3365601 RepID=UPI0037B74419
MTDIVQAPNIEEARARADRIRSGMRVLAEWQQDVITAYAAQDWVALGYETWDAYLDGEYGEHRVRLPREQRREIVAGMSAAGMSTRAIGAALGTGNATVHRDLQSSVSDETDARPDVVLSLDGRERPATRPAPEENFWDEPGTDEVVDAEVVDEPTRSEPAKPKRRPLPEALTDAGRDLARTAERLVRLTEDDRFPRNRDITHHQMPELLGALDNTTRLIQAMHLDQAQTSEEARRWWATSLHNISDALTDVANSLEQEK